MRHPLGSGLTSTSESAPRVAVPTCVTLGSARMQRVKTSAALTVTSLVRR